MPANTKIYRFEKVLSKKDIMDEIKNREQEIENALTWEFKKSQEKKVRALKRKLRNLNNTFLSSKYNYGRTKNE